ncbi:hypothetical protein ABIE52_006944 [Rhodococcus sp. OAS809]
MDLQKFFVDLLMVASGSWGGPNGLGKLLPTFLKALS